MLTRMKLAGMKRDRNFRRKARKLSVQQLRFKLLEEVNRLNNALNNIGIVYDQQMSSEQKERMVAEAQGQCAYISNCVDYLFERLEALEAKP
jgi:transcription termination factor NusB